MCQTWIIGTVVTIARDHARERQQRRRARLRAGRIRLVVEMPEIELIDRLIAVGLLQSEESDDQAKIEAALRVAVEKFCHA